MFRNIRNRSRQKSTKEKEPLTRNTLPIEIWLEIASYVVGDEKTLRRLAQIDRVSRNACTPLLYKEVHIYQPTIRESLQQLPPDRYLPYVKVLHWQTCWDARYRDRVALFLAGRRIEKMIHLEHVTLGYPPSISGLVSKRIALLDRLRSVAIYSFTLPQAAPRLRSSLVSLTLSLADSRFVNIYTASRHSLTSLSVDGPSCTILTNTLYAYPPPHLTTLRIYHLTNCPNINAVLSSLIISCPTITHLAIPWLDRPLVIPSSSLRNLGVLESPFHCVQDIVPGRPVHTYNQARGSGRWGNIPTVLNALRRSTSCITVLQLSGGQFNSTLRILNGVEPLISALRVLQFYGCTISYVR